ncbi:glutamyl-tRNA reductase [Knoellia sp. S7-12]|uniref:glutamyl-tRNA reductase n=1 Tax=Knoellia sp. S7-12 TaxID=3126698 RepID=UPI003366DA4C
MIGRLVMAGISHAQAPQELLERVAVRQTDLPTFLEDLRGHGDGDTVLLSTCSRTEVYTVCQPARSGALRTIELLERRAGLARAELDSVVEVRAGAAVVEHLFQVTAGLKSRVVGEPDVQAQVRRAYRTARSVGMTGRDVERLFPAALRSAERAHLQTELGQRGRSLACRAVDVGLERSTGASYPRTLVVGSGHMAAAATNRLLVLGKQVRVAARNEAYALKMAGPDAVCSLGALVDEIRQADLLICATSAAHPVVTVEHVHEAMRGRSRELTVVDLSVPRNVDPLVARTTGVTVVEMAALSDDAQNDPAGLAAVHKAQTMVLDAANRFVEDMAARDAGPLIRALREQVELDCRVELLRRAPDLSSEALDEAAHAAAGRLLHGPTLALRAAAATGDSAALLRLADTLNLTIDSAATA